MPQNLVHGEVGDQVAVAEDDVVLTDALVDVGTNARERLHPAAEGCGLIDAVVGEGRQELETAVLAAHVPGLAAAEMVKQALVVAVEHHANVGHARVLQAREQEVDDAVASAEGHRGRHAVLHQFAQLRLFFIGKNDCVQSVHLSVSFPSRLYIRFVPST